MTSQIRKWARLILLLGFICLILSTCKKDDKEEPGPPLPQGIIIHVPQDYPTIKMATDSAGINDTIIIACGEYHEHDIELKAGTSLVSETGDPNCVTINADSLGRCLRFNGSIYASSILGIRFINGRMILGEFPDNAGGAIYSEGNAPLTITNCSFTGNTAEEGGGIRWGNQTSRGSSKLTIIDCVFKNDSPSGSYYDDYINVYASALVCQSCSFIGEKGVSGGGINIWSTTYITFNNCLFQNNYGYYQAGVSISEGSVTFDQCIWENNEGYYGAGLEISLTSSAIIKNCLFKKNTGYYGSAIRSSASLTIQDCIFEENKSEDHGAIYTQQYYGININIENCTFVGNSVSSGLGAAIYGTGGGFNIRRSIISNCLEGTAVYMAESVPITIECTDIWGNIDGNWVGNIENLAGVNGNFSLDPMFSNTSYNLNPSSPCAPENNSCYVLIGAMPVN
jgi:hypothetical protein